MNSRDFDLLCNALAFTAVAVSGDGPTKDGAQRAAGLAYLIKEFCRTSVPDAFAEISSGEKNPVSPKHIVDPRAPGKFEAIDRMATVIAQLMRKNEGCLPQDLIASGFTSEDVDRHWAMAKALAHVELNMLDS